VTTKKDIVSRLRECDQGLLEECQEPELGDIVTDCSSIAEAANLIEQLREEREELRKQLFEVDEARRELQANEVNRVFVVRLKGWICFQYEEKNHNA
jgi:hypothetical protein